MNPESTPVGSNDDINPIGKKQQKEMLHESTPMSSIEDINPIGKQQEEAGTESTAVGSIKETNSISKQQQEKEPESTPVGPMEEKGRQSTRVGSIEEINPMGKQKQEMEPESTPVGSIEEINPISKPQQQETNLESTPIDSIQDVNPLSNKQEKTDPKGKSVGSTEKHPESTPIGSIGQINPIGTLQGQETTNLATLYADSQRPVFNLPRADLLGSRDDYIHICIPLFNASMSGDWKTAKAILRERPEMVRFSITENHETALHVAAMAKGTKLTVTFVENLVKMMTREDLELQNKNWNTALCLAAANGNVKVVRTLGDKNRALLDIPGSQQMMPLYMACLFGQREMVNYLYDNSNYMTGDFWTHQKRVWVFEKCVEAHLFDVALKIVSHRPELARSGNLLLVLARKKDAFKGLKPYFILRVIDQILAVIHVKIERAEKPSDAMKLLRIIWSEIVKLPKISIDEIIRGPADAITDLKEPKVTSRVRRIKHSSRVLFVAAEVGNTEFVVELIRKYPDLIWKLNDNNQSIFHVAVSHRHEGIYNLLHEIGSMKDMITPLKDEDGNNMLHLVGKTAMKMRLQDVSGLAQMQRELLWFKEVEALLPPTYREKKNRDGLTPHELFSNEHKELMSINEAWMKDTANQCLVVATLIASIGFAAAFAVPGGYNQDNGIPLFLKKICFIIFTISDAISVAFSSISILTLLSIFTSRYAELDFLESLPNKLMRGIATLYLSLASMLVGFSVSFFLLFKKELIWVPIVISIFTSVPVILYVRRQYELLKDVYQSTHGYLFKPKKRMLFYQNPRF